MMLMMMGTVCVCVPHATRNTSFDVVVVVVVVVEFFNELLFASSAHKYIYKCHCLRPFSVVCVCV